MQTIRILVALAIAALFVLSVIISIRRKRFCLLKAKSLLGSLRGENEQLKTMAPDIRVELLLFACADAGVTLEKIGTSRQELDKICRQYREKNAAK